MKICLLQTDIVWQDVTANIATAESLIEQAPEANLYVLPEMWATGFCMNPTAETFRAAEQALAWMKAFSARHGQTIMGSLPWREKGEDRATNRLFVVGHGAVTAVYDKRHLFGYGGEKACYQAGSGRTIVEIGGLKVLILTCYDLRFPVFSRNFAAAYDLVVYVANWPESRQTAWQTLLKARAIENQCFVCGVNRTGNDPVCHYAGGSMLIDAYGKTLADFDANVQAATITLDADRLRHFRQKFPVLADADAFTLH